MLFNKNKLTFQEDESELYVHKESSYPQFLLEGGEKDPKGEKKRGQVAKLSQEEKRRGQVVVSGRLEIDFVSCVLASFFPSLASHNNIHNVEEAKKVSIVAKKTKKAKKKNVEDDICTLLFSDTNVTAFFLLREIAFHSFFSLFNVETISI